MHAKIQKQKRDRTEPLVALVVIAFLAPAAFTATARAESDFAVRARLQAAHLNGFMQHMKNISAFEYWRHGNPSEDFYWIHVEATYQGNPSSPAPYLVFEDQINSAIVSFVVPPVGWIDGHSHGGIYSHAYVHLGPLAAEIAGCIQGNVRQAILITQDPATGAHGLSTMTLGNTLEVNLHGFDPFEWGSRFAGNYVNDVRMNFAVSNIQFLTNMPSVSVESSSATQSLSVGVKLSDIGPVACGDWVCEPSEVSTCPHDCGVVIEDKTRTAE